MSTITFIVSAIAVIIGVAVGYVVRKFLARREIEGAEAKAQNLINEAKSKQKELLLQAKDKALGIIDEAKKEEQQRRRDLAHMQQRLEKRESIFDQKLLDY